MCRNHILEVAFSRANESSVGGLEAQSIGMIAMSLICL